LRASVGSTDANTVDHQRKERRDVSAARISAYRRPPTLHPALCRRSRGSARTTISIWFADNRSALPISSLLG
jgi:hypothetical protein